MVALVWVPGGRPGLPSAEGVRPTGMARCGTVVRVDDHVPADHMYAIAYNIRHSGFCAQHSWVEYNRRLKGTLQPG
jgi:hypothetical protein